MLVVNKTNKLLDFHKNLYTTCRKQVFKLTGKSIKQISEYSKEFINSLPDEYSKSKFVSSEIGYKTWIESDIHVLFYFIISPHFQEAQKESNRRVAVSFFIEEV